MPSRQSTPLELDSTASQASAAPSGSSLPNAFGRMMTSREAIQATQNSLRRDRCKRPTPIYNSNYNPFESPSGDVPPAYSPYVFGEPLFDDREVVIARLPKHHTVAPPAKKPRTAWVWKLGYALTDHSKPSKPTIWACKHCMLSSNL